MMMTKIISIVAVANACWSLEERRDIEGFSELDNILVLSFRDAVTCKPVDGATVRFGELEYRTDESGNLELPMQPFAAQMDAKIPVTVERRGYITLEANLIVAAGTVLNRRMVMSQALAPDNSGQLFVHEAETYVYSYLPDRNWHLVARKSRSPVSFQYMRDYNNALNSGASGSLDNFGLKILLAYHEYFNNFQGF